MELFINEPELTFESPKVAMAQLDEDPQNWARQILTELYRQVPESSEYGTPQVMFSKVDPEQGFGLGVVVVTSATDSALSAVRPGAQSKRALVPVVVKNHLLCPLDLIMTSTGKMTPLNGRRLRQALFRPETFEMVTDDWGDTTLYNMFYPPGRSDNDFGAGISQGVGGGTQGAVTMIQGPGMKLSGDVRFEMLDSLRQTILAPDVQKVADAIDSTPGLLEALQRNDVFMAGVGKVASAEQSRVDPEDLYKTAFATIEPDVLQMGYSEDHRAYWVKRASRSHFFHEEPQLMSRGRFLKWAGHEVAHKVDTEGVVTLSATSSEADGENVDASKWSLVEEPGIYKVKTIHGKELTGWVLPNLVDLDGTRLPMSIFTNGSQAMIQDEIVGAKVGTGVDLPSAPAKGTGVFYCAGPGGVIATAPLLVVGSEAEMGGGDSYLVQSMTGEASKVRLVPGLKTLKVLGNEFHVPDTAKFLPLDEEGMVPLVSQPTELSKTSADRAAPRIVLYGGDGQEFGLRFENLPKLASMVPTRQDRETAAFTLCLAGCSSQGAYEKLAAASSGHTVNVEGLGDVRLARDLVSEARKVAAVESQKALALRQYLVKEAATLPDVLTVDAVLSLGFINSENVRMFVSRIPYLEKALSMVAELLLASRLGVSEIPEYAAARCVRALDETIQGLKALSLRDVQEGSIRKN